MDAGTWIQESRTRKRVPSKQFLPNHSIPSNQIGQATEAPFPGEAWFMYLLKEKGEARPRSRGFRKQVYRTLGCELHGVPSGVVQRPKV